MKNIEILDIIILGSGPAALCLAAELANKDLVRLSMQEYKLSEANKALHDLNNGKVKGRAVLIP